MRRAVSEDQKGRRRQAILEEAWSMFLEEGYEAIHMQELARRVGLAKGTLYLYFETKEELFFVLQEERFSGWFVEVERRFQSEGFDASAEGIAQAVTEALLAFPGLTRLFAILHTTLERNVGYASVLRFKQMLRVRLGEVGALLESRVSGVKVGDGQRLLLWAYALVIGMQHLSEPVPVVRQVLADHPDLAIFSVDFTQNFYTSFLHLLRGYFLKGE